MTTLPENPKPPLPVTPPAGSGLYGGEVEASSSLAPAPGGSPRPDDARGAVPDAPMSGMAASPSRRPPVRGGLASDAPSPSRSHSTQGDRDGEGLAPDRGAAEGSAPRSGQAPAGGAAVADTAPLAGQEARKAWKAAESANAKAARNRRGKPWTAKRQPRQQPGMIRRMPPSGGAA